MGLQSLGVYFQCDLSQAADPLAASPAIGDPAQSPPVEMTALVGLYDDSLQPFRIRTSRKVKQNPLPDDHRDPPLKGDFVLVKSPGLVEPNSPVPFGLEST